MNELKKKLLARHLEREKQATSRQVPKHMIKFYVGVRVCGNFGLAGILCRRSVGFLNPVM